MIDNCHSYYIISNLDFLQKNAATKRMLHYAKALADKQNKVYLISCCSTELVDNYFIEIEPFIYILNKKEITSKFFETFFFLRRLNRFAELKNCTKSFLLYPTAFIHTEILILLYLKLYKRCLVFYELNEVRKYASSYQAPISFKRVLYSLKKIIFNSVFNLAPLLLYFYDGLICISSEIEKYGRSFNNYTIRTPILTNPAIDIDVSENKYFTENVFNIGFSGSIHPIKEDMKNFIDVIEKLKTQGYQVSFNLCGTIFKTYKEYFLRQCELRKELNYYGLLNDLELSTFLSQQQILVIPRGYTLQNKYGFSTKLSDYLDHKKVVLVTDISDNRLYIKDGENGFIVPTDDSGAMFKKLVYIMENFKSLETQIISNAHETSKRFFDYTVYTEHLRYFLKAKKQKVIDYNL